MEQQPSPVPASPGDIPGLVSLAPDSALPTDPFALTAEHLDRAHEALVAVLKSPQAKLAGKRPYDALRDALIFLDHYWRVVVHDRTNP